MRPLFGALLIIGRARGLLVATNNLAGIDNNRVVKTRGYFSRQTSTFSVASG